MNKGKATKARIKERVSSNRKRKRSSGVAEPTGHSAGFGHDLEFPVQV
jgi:hypothetical protein